MWTWLAVICVDTASCDLLFASKHCQQRVLEWGRECMERVLKWGRECGEGMLECGMECRKEC